MTFRQITLADAAARIIDNRGRTCPTSDTGIPLIATNCIKDDQLYPVYENVRYVSQETYNSWFRGHPEPGDLIFVCKGAPGRVAIAPDPVDFVIAQDMVAIRPDQRLVHPRYLYYVLKSKNVRERIANLHVGTMIPHFKKGDFSQLRFFVHADFKEQAAIAEVLGALDDKIAANTRTSAKTQTLADLEFISSWKVLRSEPMPFGDIAKINGGGTPSTKTNEYWNGSVSWATPTDMTSLTGSYLESTSRTITEAGLKHCSSKLFAPGAILMTSRATIGAIAFAGVATAVNQGFIVVEPYDKDFSLWLFHDMKRRTDEFISWANGATFLELSRGTFKKLKTHKPDSAGIEEFNRKVSPLHEASRALQKENVTLTTLRDALLPHLMSGKLRVRDAEKVVSDAV